MCGGRVLGEFGEIGKGKNEKIGEDRKRKGGNGMGK